MSVRRSSGRRSSRKRSSSPTKRSSKSLYKEVGSIELTYDALYDEFVESGQVTEKEFMEIIGIGISDGDIKSDAELRDARQNNPRAIRIDIDTSSIEIDARELAKRSSTEYYDSIDEDGTLKEISDY